jgi:hypothetical protein
VNDYLTYKYGLQNIHPRTVLSRSRRESGSDKRELHSAIPRVSPARSSRRRGGRNLWIGTHTFLWDGRADDTTDPTTGFAPGELIAEVVQTPQEYQDFCLFFETPAPLKPSHVIVAKTLPAITGTGTAPEIEVQSNPYFVQPSYDQSSALTFKLDQAAFVFLHILEPGSIASVVSSIEIDYDSVAPGQQAVPANLPFTYHWKGHPDSGTAGESNELEAEFDGPYTFALEAKNAQDTTLSSVYRGVIHVRGEGEEP